MNPTSSDPASAPPCELDAAALARLRELDPDGRHGVLPRVMAAFDRSLARSLEQLEAELAQGPDPARVSLLAHTLKSSSGSVGALGLAGACAEVERRLRGGDVSHLREDVEHLLAQGRVARACVAAMLQG